MNFEKRQQHKICIIYATQHTLKNKCMISVCDDYSLPLDFIKFKRPSSFDPGLAECLPNNWPSPSTEHVTFLDQQQQFLLQQLNYPLHQQQQQFDTKSRLLEEQQQQLQFSNQQDLQQQRTGTAQGFIDESGNLCILQFAPETLDDCEEVAGASTKQRHSTREKTRSSQKRRKKKKARQQKTKAVTRKIFDSSVPNSSENEEERIKFDNEDKVPELNSPDSIGEDILNPLEQLPFKSPKRLTTFERSKTSPSPYYYSDLLKKKTIEAEREQLFELSQQQLPRTTANTIRDKELAFKNKKSNSLDTPVADKEVEVSTPKRYSITEEGVRIIRCDSPSSTTSDDSDCSECQKRREWHSHALAVVRAATQNIRAQRNLGANNSNNLDDVEPEVYYQNSIVTQMPQSRFLDNQTICACATPNFGDDADDQLFQPRSIFYVHQQGFQECADCSITDDEQLKALIFDEMNVRQRKIYETAFDSKIAKSDDDLDDVDRITNHSASLFGNEYRMVTSQSKDSFTGASTPNQQHPKEKRYRSKHSKKAQQQQNNNINYNNNINNNGSSKSEEDILTKDIENLKIEESIDNIVNANVQASTTTTNTQYTPSPPSTAPLPLKFPTKHEKFFINSIKSAPNLPASNNALQHPRLKDLRGSEKSESSSKERPRSVIVESGRVFELKRSHSGRNYSSSIESMATSSSGGSMESIRSSTSEGNRSTTSNESRHSSTLSSHSSDSGPSVARPLKTPLLIHPKLQILSPISDKSTQEPSENSENKKMTPGDENNGDKLVDDNIDKDVKQKKRPAASKTLLLIARDEIQGSDSGISLHSRDDKAKLSALFDSNKIDNATGLPQDLKDLPFDMPKLRRRRIQLSNQNSGASGSATSVDLGDLPFDMPKLRRRMRVGGVNLILPNNISNNLTNNVLNNNLSGTDTSGVSQASSSQSVLHQDDHPIIGGSLFRQNLTLNLNDAKASKMKKKPFGTLDLHGLTDSGNISRSSIGMSFNVGGFNRLNMALIDDSIPLERQGFYHGAITRIDAENILRQLNEGSFLVRNSESTKQDYSLSLKSAKGFMHMRIQQNDTGEYILGQFSRPFKSIPEMIRHFCLNRLPVRGAEHMCLLEPVIAQLL
ncbi:hypothetical protein PVAND_002182 [Polypedilum vanderplanki]|uniref:SH2 domain-containing adapter protein D n=1 Tax=Polypedilum vanderplanki TaxID=319348 RepID=A0A9J6BQ81_POLVA|nr:hypothetical protein PVAND_002182 [Polypedilum vanderplanki]